MSLRDPFGEGNVMLIFHLILLFYTFLDHSNFAMCMHCFYNYKSVKQKKKETREGGISRRHYGLNFSLFPGY